MRLTRVLILLPIFLLGAACGDGGSDIEPRDGAWDYNGGPPVDDTCMIDQLAVDDPGAFTITNNGDGTFTVNDGKNEFDCTIDGTSFSCPSRLAGSDDIGVALNFDATVSYNISASGSFSSDTAMSGRQDIVVSCAGADCATVEALVMVTTPCGWGQEFTASAK